MAGKKSFTGQQNPALAFISAQEPEGGAEDKKRLQIETRPLYQRKEAEASSAAHVKTTDAPEGFKANPLFVETKAGGCNYLYSLPYTKLSKQGQRLKGKA